MILVQNQRTHFTHNTKQLYISNINKRRLMNSYYNKAKIYKNFTDFVIIL